MKNPFSIPLKAVEKQGIHGLLDVNGKVAVHVFDPPWVDGDQKVMRAKTVYAAEAINFFGEMEDLLRDALSQNEWSINIAGGWYASNLFIPKARDILARLDAMRKENNNEQS